MFPRFLLLRVRACKRKEVGRASLNEVGRGGRSQVACDFSRVGPARAPLFWLVHSPIMSGFFTRGNQSSSDDDDSSDEESLISSDDEPKQKTGLDSKQEKLRQSFLKGAGSSDDSSSDEDSDEDSDDSDREGPVKPVRPLVVLYRGACKTAES